MLDYIRSGAEVESAMPSGAWFRRWGLSAVVATLPPLPADHDSHIPADHPDPHHVPVRVKQLWKRAEDGDCDEWQLEGPRFVLGLIVLLHSVTRLLARGADARKNDAEAIELARSVIDDGLDGGLAPIERVSLYLPLMHSPQPHDRKQAAHHMSILAAQYPGHYGGLLSMLHTHAASLAGV